MNYLPSWRTALRIAHREARRAKGRSVLVVAMIALPVLFLTFAAVSYDMFTLTGAELADRTMGTASARITWTTHMPAAQMPNPDDGHYNDPSLPRPAGASQDAKGDEAEPTQAQLVAALPPGSTSLTVRRGSVLMRVPDGIGGLDAVSVDASTPLTDGFVRLLGGRVPAAPTEVALTPQAMARLAVGLGGVVKLADGTHPYTVVGEIEFPSLLSTVVLFAPPAGPLPAGLNLDQTSWLVKTPQPVTWTDVLRYNALGMIVTSRAVLIDPPPADRLVYQAPQSFVDNQTLRLTVLIAGLALLEIVLMAGPAFAVSARRRQRQLALVAANGGTPAHIRRIVLADGIVLGGVGAVLGIGLGIAAAFVARPVLEVTLAHARAGGYRVFPLALLAIALLAVVTGVLAAVVPAFITARQNIIASLAGRRGIVRSRRRWLVLGLVTCAAGAAVVFAGTTRPDTSIILAGLILGELGLVLCTPSLVGLVARVGAVLPLGPRIALRDAARNRAAAAPAISAVMAAVAGSVAIGLYLTSSIEQQRAEYAPLVPTGYAQAFFAGPDDAAPASLEPARVALRTSLPVTELHDLTWARCAAASPSSFCDLRLRQVPALACPYSQTMRTVGHQLIGDQARAAWADPRCARGMRPSLAFGVDDGAGVAALTGARGDDLVRAQATLRAGGVVVADPLYLDGAAVTVEMVTLDPGKINPETDPGNISSTSLPGYLLTSAALHDRAIVSPATATRLGLVVHTTGVVAVTARPPTQAEEDRMRLQLQALGFDGVVERGAPVFTDIRILVLMAAAAAITLAAAGVATALAAADGRQDLSTLAAVGASPRLRRGLSLSQSGVIAGLGSALGALAGVAAATAIIEVLNQSTRAQWPGPTPLPITLPWASLAVALLVVPGVAMIGAGTLTRSRLPIERRL